jgi:hypothetical protein
VVTWRAYDARLACWGPFHVRRDLPDGSKRVTWRSPSGAPGLGEHRMEDLVYLPWDRASMPARVIITEGEKASEAVSGGDRYGIGTVCGASGTPGPQVVALFTGCHVTLWPDADRVGFDHMARLARRLEPVVASLRLVDIPEGVPDGWDAADADLDTIRRLTRDAHDVYLFRPDSSWLRPMDLAA